MPSRFDPSDVDGIVIDRALDGFTPFERTAVFLKFTIGYTDRQIGDLLFASDPAVHPDQCRDRARDLLRSILRRLSAEVAA